VSEANWSLRVPADFEAFYDEQRARATALDVATCLCLALRR
jgi:hypothetical protein